MDFFYSVCCCEIRKTYGGLSLGTGASMSTLSYTCTTFGGRNNFFYGIGRYGRFDLRGRRFMAVAVLHEQEKGIVVRF